MCGFAGWVDWEKNVFQNKNIIEKMTECLVHRGPDAGDYWITTRVGMGHRRLVVVDPEGGKQPMLRTFKSRQYTLVYNGELYNTEEIRCDLIERGYWFQSYSDTEVLLISYIEWGPDCVKHFNGIFAFAIWDESEQSLFLARDRMGVKPLFYAIRNQSIIFGSELKALLAHPAVEARIDRQGLQEIFGLGPARSPGCGVFQNVEEIRPGFWGMYTRTGLRLYRYWQLQSFPHEDSFEDTVQKVRRLTQDAIERQLVSDVPVCTFLSGGLDSSVISAIASRNYQKNQKGTLRTFSVDYVENDRFFQANDFQPNQDSPWIRKASEYLGTEHKTVILDNEHLFTALHKAVIARDLPGMADVDSSLWLFCREIKKEATVALSGECADEVFGGYPWFYRKDALNSGTFPWSPTLETRRFIISKDLGKELNLDEYVQWRYHESLAETPYMDGEEPIDARRRELFYLNLQWFMQVLLDRKDRMSMASGLEVRVPYCDHRLVEYVWNIPWQFKTYNGQEKGILRQAMRGILPDEVIFRKKSPYPKTFHPDYLQFVKTETQHILSDISNPILQLINKNNISDLLQSDLSKINRPWFGQLMTGPQLLAYLIQMNIWMKEYKIKLI